MNIGIMFRVVVIILWLLGKGKENFRDVVFDFELFKYKSCYLYFDFLLCEKNK